MTNEILVALITGGLTLVGVLISNSKSNAVMRTELNELTREVREHNNFARRMPVVEESKLRPSSPLLSSRFSPRSPCAATFPLTMSL